MYSLRRIPQALCVFPVAPVIPMADLAFLLRPAIMFSGGLSGPDESRKFCGLHLSQRQIPGPRAKRKFDHEKDAATEKRTGVPEASQGVRQFFILLVGRKIKLRHPRRDDFHHPPVPRRHEGMCVRFDSGETSEWFKIRLGLRQPLDREGRSSAESASKFT